jgi:hypothetical protein
MKNALVTKVPCIPSSPVEKLNGIGVVALHVVFAKPFVGHCTEPAGGMALIRSIERSIRERAITADEINMFVEY